ncbi:hypothetical protein [Metabacillus sp. FJAT-53654]|uniref:Uncharacterized protein n=1 Tax=Metabacillus rhizosphaerae TaxID=3117747 RepID=A0ABZ2MW95_9BACI
MPVGQFYPCRRHALESINIVEKGVWKIYETTESGGHFIIKELDNENETIDYFYNLLVSRNDYIS